MPINNDDNFNRAITIARPLLRLIIARKGKHIWFWKESHVLTTIKRKQWALSNFKDPYPKILQQWLICTKIPSHTCFEFLGDSLEEITGYGTMRPKNLISSLLGQTPVKTKSLAISNPHDFRQVIITLWHTKLIAPINVNFLFQGLCNHRCWHSAWNMP